MPQSILNSLNIGDEEAYIDLFKEHYVGLCAYSRRYVGRTDIAEEIVSDTFMKIWENRKSLKINTSVKAYLFHAVCNNSLYYLRKLKGENQLVEFFQETKSENIAFAITSMEVEENSLIMEDFCQKIEKAIDNLPGQQQIAFRLKRLEGKKTREVAEIMGLSVKTVEMHLSKALLNLRKNLKNQLPPFLLFLIIK